MSTQDKKGSQSDRYRKAKSCVSEFCHLWNKSTTASRLTRLVHFHPFSTIFNSLFCRALILPPGQVSSSTLAAQTNPWARPDGHSTTQALSRAPSGLAQGQISSQPQGMWSWRWRTEGERVQIMWVSYSTYLPAWYLPCRDSQGVVSGHCNQHITLKKPSDHTKNQNLTMCWARKEIELGQWW